MKACPLEESYLLPYDIFFHPISYVMVSFTSFLFIYSNGRSDYFPYDWFLFESVDFIFVWI